MKKIAAGRWRSICSATSERTGIARVGNSKRELRFLKRFALNRTKRGKLLLHDPLFAAKVSALEIELIALPVLEAQGGFDGGPVDMFVVV